jgi:hypothetical protein
MAPESAGAQAADGHEKLERYALRWKRRKMAGVHNDEVYCEGACSSSFSSSVSIFAGFDFESVADDEDDYLQTMMGLGLAQGAVPPPGNLVMWRAAPGAMPFSSASPSPTNLWGIESAAGRLQPMRRPVQDFRADVLWWRRDRRTRQREKFVVRKPTSRSRMEIGIFRRHRPK